MAIDLVAIQALVASLTASFSTNLVAVLQYGSSTGNGQARDLDLVVVLGNKADPARDMAELKRIRGAFPAILDLQLMYRTEIVPGGFFSLDTHGQFVVEILRGAVALVGENPFVGLPYELQEVRASIVRKLQYYVFRCRQHFLGYPIHVKNEAADSHRKKLEFAMQDILLGDAIAVPADEAVRTFLARYPDVLTEEDLARFASSMDLDALAPLYEKLYDFALVRFAPAPYAGIRREEGRA